MSAATLRQIRAIWLEAARQTRYTALRAHEAPGYVTQAWRVHRQLTQLQRGRL
jgi:hypothetical protein